MKKNCRYKKTGRSETESLPVFFVPGYHARKIGYGRSTDDFLLSDPIDPQNQRTIQIDYATGLIMGLVRP